MVLGRPNLSAQATKMRSRGASTLRVTNRRPDGVGIEINTEPGIPPLRVNRTALNVNLNADRLDGHHAADFLGVGDQAADSALLSGYEADHLIRAGYDATTNAANANGEAATVRIGVPQPGLLVMSGTIDAYGDTYDLYRCRLTVDGTVVDGTQMASVIEDAGGDHTRNTEENCSTTGVQPVAVGWYDVALDITARDTVDFDDASLWVLYVPFNQGGNPPSVP
jgi:hypothetical protein